MNNNDSERLAFEVGVSEIQDSPEILADDFQPVQETTNNPVLSDSIRKYTVGHYFVISPGITFPYKNQTSNSRHRVYEPGFSLSFSGGYGWEGFKLGGGFLYRNNKHDPRSYEKSVGGNLDFVHGSSSSTFGGFVEIGYDLDVTDYFKFYSILSLGYGVSLIEDYSKELDSNDRTRIDPTFLANLGFGVTYSATENIGLQLGYRFLYEDEVPAHTLELGLNGNF